MQFQHHVINQFFWYISTHTNYYFYDCYSISFSGSKANKVLYQSPNTDYEIAIGVSISIIFLTLLCVTLAVIAWFVRRRTHKINRSEPINFSTLQRADENSYQKVDAFNLAPNNVSCSEKTGAETECSEVLKCEQSDM